MDALHDELIEALEKSDFRAFLQGQQDADEFIAQLSGNFIAPERENIHLFTSFSTLGQDVEKKPVEHETPRLLIVPNEDEEIDIQKCYQEMGFLEGVSSYLPQGDAKLCFGKHDIVTHFPEILEIKINRGIAHNNGPVCRSKIHFDEPGKLILNEFAPETTSSRAKIKSICTYQVVAAIERRGKSTNSGHYVTHIRANDGSISTHSDRKVIPGQDETVWENAYYLILKRINRHER